MSKPTSNEKNEEIARWMGVKCWHDWRESINGNWNCRNCSLRHICNDNYPGGWRPKDNPAYDSDKLPRYVMNEVEAKLIAEGFGEYYFDELIRLIAINEEDNVTVQVLTAAAEQRRNAAYNVITEGK